MGEFMTQPLQVWHLVVVATVLVLWLLFLTGHVLYMLENYVSNYILQLQLRSYPTYERVQKELDTRSGDCDKGELATLNGNFHAMVEAQNILRNRITQLEERKERDISGPYPASVGYDDFHRLEKMVYEMRERSFSHRVARWLGVA